MAPGRPYQLSHSCLHFAMDASQVRDGPLIFCGRVGFFNVFVCRIDVEARAYVRTAVYVTGNK